MAENIEELEVEKILQELDSFLQKYELVNNVSMCESNAAVYESLNLDQKQLKALSSEDVLIHAYLIQTYISSLTHTYNKEMARLDWATDAFNDLLHHYIPITEFDDYTKFETKEQIVCESYPVVGKLREIMRKSKTVCTLYNNKFPALTKISDILFQLTRSR